MKARLRALWQWLRGDPLPRCHDCRQLIHGSYSSDMTAPVDQPIYRHHPACPPGA